MDLLIGLIIGLLIGWLVQWLIDWRFWQPRNEQLRDALAEAQAQLAALKEARQQDRLVRQELAKVKSELASYQSPNVNLLQQRLTRANAQIEALQEARLRDRLAKNDAPTRELSSRGQPTRGRQSVSDWHDAEVTEGEGS